MYITSDLAKLIPLPHANAHKYSRGKCVLIAGSCAYPGAALLASWASQYAGAGYTEVFCAEENKALLQIKRPSLVVRAFSECAPKKLISPGNPGAVVVGPGLDTTDSQANTLALKVFKKATYPLLIDGGALSFLATKEGRKALQSRQSTEALAVLTPHAGEAARLAQAANVEAANPYELSAKLANVYHSLVVLKGPETIISDGLRTEIFTYGTPSLAKAGTGDVLSGIIGGLLAQGLSEFDAAYLGVSLHAKAAKIAANSLTEVCVCAEEVLEALPQAFHAYLSMLEQ